MNRVFTFDNRIALVTGATSGIGRAIAISLSNAGCKVILCGRNKQRAEEVNNSICRNGGISAIVIGDISTEQGCADIVENAAGIFGGIDILVNCAGILTATKVSDITEAEWNNVISTNLSGTFFMIQKCLPYLQNGNNPRIINLSSNAGRMGGYSNSQAYTASKGGIIAITMGIARQLAPLGITVNVVCPGTTMSEMSKEKYSKEQLNKLTERIPLGRLGTPEDSSSAVTFFASNEAGFITGAILDVNGGMFMG